MKRIIRFAKIAVLIAATMTLGACGGYQATDTDRLHIEAIIGRFQFGIERYDIPSMTGDLSDAFILTLREGSLEYSKTLSALREELEADATDQSYWRNNYGYRLQLVLTGGNPLFNDRYATARSGFTVIESSDGIDPITTDTGTIDWQFVKMGDYWRVAAMTITFNTTASSAAMDKSFSFSGSPFFRRSSR